MPAMRIGVAAAALALTATAAAAERPAIYTIWAETTLDRQACLQRAQAVLAASGIRVESTLQWSVFGVRGDHVIAIRCVPERTMVYIAAAGPNYELCKSLSDQVAKGF